MNQYKKMLTSPPPSPLPDQPDPPTNKSPQNTIFSMPLDRSSTSSSPEHHPASPPPPHCSACSLPILDRYLLSVLDRLWHERCLRCALCGHLLTRSCYVKDRTLYCKLDYFRLFSIKCASCQGPISASTLVMRVQDSIYHTGCFNCARCGRELTKGDEFSIRQGRLLCRQHLEPIGTVFDELLPPGQGGHDPDRRGGGGTLPPGSFNSNVPQQSGALRPAFDAGYSSHAGPSPADGLIQNSTETYSPAGPSPGPSTSTASGPPSAKPDGRRGPKRPRTILTVAQRRAFKASFEISQKPCRKVRESLANETGLSVRIVQVWFQNQRAKLKKNQRKAQQTGLGGSGTKSPFLMSESSGIGSCKDDSTEEEEEEAEDEDSKDTAFSGVQSMAFLSPECNSRLGTTTLEDCETSLDDPLVPNGTQFTSHLMMQHYPTFTRMDQVDPETIQLSTEALTPIDKLYSMQSSYFTVPSQLEPECGL